MTVVSDLKKEKVTIQKSSLFGHVPESILNHENNKEQLYEKKVQARKATTVSSFSKHGGRMPERADARGHIQRVGSAKNKPNVKDRSRTVSPARGKPSPSAGRGVQFDKGSVGDDQDEEKNFDGKSNDTAPLVTDSGSEEENQD